MIATLRGLLALALLVGLYLIPVALVFSALFLLTFFIDVLTGNGGLSLLSALGMGTLLYATFTTRPAAGTLDGASVTVTRQTAPDLWIRVTSLADRVGTRPPAELRLTAQAGAEVTEEPRMLGLIPGRRRMYLGIPLLVTLPAKQLDFVICHELGHYARGHTRVLAICYRAGTAVRQLLERLTIMYARGRGYAGVVNLLHLWVITGYARAYHLLSFAARRKQELQADAKAAEIAGSHAAADALHSVHELAACWATFVAERACISDDKLTFAVGPFDEFLQALKSDSFRAKAAANRPAASRGPFDSHPPLKERLGRILGKAVDGRGGPTVPPVAAAAADVPLTAKEQDQLFRDELRIQRDRAAGSARVQLAPVPAGTKARARRRLRLLTEHPVAATMTMVIVFGAYGSGLFEGNKHPHPIIGVPAPVPYPTLDLPSVDPSAFPTLGPSDFPSLQPSDLPSFSPPRASRPVAEAVTVQPGETLTSIACHFDTTVAAIQRLNHLGTATRIWPGQVIFVPLTRRVNHCLRWAASVQRRGQPRPLHRRDRSGHRPDRQQGLTRPPNPTLRHRPPSSAPANCW